MTTSDRNAQIRVLIVADVRLYREGLALVLAQVPRMNIVAAIAKSEARSRAIESKPDVIVYDTALRGGFEVLGDLQEVQPRPRLLAIGVGENEHDIVACAAAGAMGFVNRSASLEELVATIEAVACGRSAASSGILDALLRRASAGAVPDITRLTQREREVLVLVRRGMSNKEIATTLSIGLSTVKNHVHSLLEKLDVRRRSDVARTRESVHEFTNSAVGI